METDNCSSFQGYRQQRLQKQQVPLPEKRVSPLARAREGGVLAGGGTRCGGSTCRHGWVGAGTLCRGASRCRSCGRRGAYALRLPTTATLRPRPPAACCPRRSALSTRARSRRRAWSRCAQSRCAWSRCARSRGVRGDVHGAGDERGAGDLHGIRGCAWSRCAWTGWGRSRRWARVREKGWKGRQASASCPDFNTASGAAFPNTGSFGMAGKTRQGPVLGP